MGHQDAVLCDPACTGGLKDNRRRAGAKTDHGRRDCRFALNQGGINGICREYIAAARLDQDVNVFLVAQGL